MKNHVDVNQINRISSGTSFEGTIISKMDLRIDGEFKGKVVSEGRIVVGENANVEGEFICENLDFWGKGKGEFTVKDTLSLRDGCNIVGNIKLKKIIVELGATFDGSCSTIKEEGKQSNKA